MPPYWPDKPHVPIYRPPLNKFVYWCFHRRFALRSRFLSRWWSERETFRILRTIARQRMRGFVVNPGGGNPLWVINGSIAARHDPIQRSVCINGNVAIPKADSYSTVRIGRDRGDAR